MRVHSRYIYYLLIMIMLLVATLGRVSEKTFLIVEFITIVVITLLGKHMRTMYELRELLHIDMNIKLLKLIVIIVLIVINILVFLKLLIKKKKFA